MTTKRRSQSFPHTSHLAPHTSIMKASWPKDDGRRYPKAVESVTRLTQVISAIRSIRADFKIPANAGLDVAVAWGNGKTHADRIAWIPQIKRLAMAEQVQIEPTLTVGRGWVPFVFDGGKGGVQVGQAIDRAKVQARIEQEVAQMRAQLEQVEARLRDQQFTSKAPKEVVEQTKDRRLQLKETLKKFSDHLSVLQSM